MSEERSPSNLMQARETYVRRFEHLVENYVLGVFDSMYLPVKRQPLKVFQARLREIPNWNAQIIKHHTDMLSLECDCLTEIIAALFVSQVKILTSIRLSNQKKSVSLKVPSNEDYIHRYFVEAARSFYLSPYCFKYDEMRKKRAVLVAAVDEAVNKLLPHRKILRACLGSFLNDDRSFDTFEEQPETSANSQEEPAVPPEMPEYNEAAYAELPPAPFEEDRPLDPPPEQHGNDVEQYKTVQTPPDGQNPQLETLDHAPFTQAHQEEMPPIKYDDYNDLFKDAEELP